MSDFFIDDNIARAKTIATEFYTSPVHFEAAKEKIFAYTWQYLTSDHSLKEPGCAQPVVLLENFIAEPLLLTNDLEGTLRCMSNVCTHRGNLLVYQPCKLAQLRCKYHGRLFSLGGQFISMPEFKEVENFPADADNLHQLPLYHWGPLLFTSLHSALPATSFLGDIVKRMDWFPMDKLVFRPELSKDYTVRANWALYCENYLEGFHIPFVHAGLNQVLNFGSYTTELFRYSNLQLGIGKKEDSCFEIPPQAQDYGKEIAAYYFWVFPNMMFNFYPWGLSVNIVHPQQVDSCKVSFLTFVSDETKLNQGAGSGLDTVEQEDEEVVQNVQTGIRSRFYTHGRYSVTREQGTHHFHQLIAEFMNE